jgi:hypothetical protein
MMEYFAGLDVSMEQTQVCVLDREGSVVHEANVASTAEAIAQELMAAPACQRIVFASGRMAPMLYHGLRAHGLPVVCIESRQAYQALKTLATHKTDRNDARGLAHLARTGFFKPVHVKSLPAHAIGADADTAIVEKVAVTPGNAHDGRSGELALPDDPGEVYADSAYRGQVFATAVRAKGGMPRVAATGVWAKADPA